MRTGPLLSALVAIALPACSWGDPEPNVLVVVVDNLRADALRAGPSVPNIDRLKQRGFVFRMCFGHTPSTTGGAASLFSGRLPHETGVSTDGHTVDDSVPLLAETLAAAGYQTYGFAGIPTLRPPSPGVGITRGFAAFQAPLDAVEDPASTNARLFELVDQADPDRPWLVYAHYSLSEDADPEPAGRLDPAARSAMRLKYFSRIEVADRAVGALLDGLRERSAYDNTLIILTSNHGTSLGQHSADDQRGGLYDEILRVPLVIKLPRNHKEAAHLRKSSNALARIVDVTPTVLDLLGIDALPSVTGRTLAQEADRQVTAEIRPPLTPTPRYARRNERYKLIYAPAEERFEMYDLARDPLELDNVFAVEGHLWIHWQDDLRTIAESDFGYTEESSANAVVSQRTQALDR